MLVNARSAVDTLNDEEKDVLAKISEILYSTDVSAPVTDMSVRESLADWTGRL